MPWVGLRRNEGWNNSLGIIHLFGKRDSLDLYEILSPQLNSATPPAPPPLDSSLQKAQQTEN